MKIFVTGATGFTGSRVVRLLLKNGYDVSCLYRASSDRSILAPFVLAQDDIEWIEGDLSDTKSLSTAISGTDALVNIASLGFGLFRPGFTTGASLAVGRHEQGDVAGKIASINGAAYIFAPAVGVALFKLWEPATFILIGASLLFLIVWGRKALSNQSTGN